MVPLSNKKELETFLGMVNYLSKFSHHLAELSRLAVTLGKLVHKDTQFYWDENTTLAFNRVKNLIAQSPVLEYFDPTKEVTLQTHASQNAVREVVLQNGKPVAYASRLLTESQTKYAQIEKELFAIVAGCDKILSVSVSENCKCTNRS